MLALKVAYLCLCLSVVDVIGDFALPRFPTAKDETECIKEANATIDDVLGMQNAGLPKTPAQNCLVTCLWKKTNVMMENGTFIPKMVAEFVRHKFELPTRALNYLRKTLNICLNNVVNIRNECFSGGYMYTCIMETREGFTKLLESKDAHKRISLIFQDRRFEML